MENTGRIRRALDPRARRIVFGDHVDAAIRDELPFYLQIDRAHLVMLVERGILPAAAGRRLLGVMGELSAEGFAALRGRPAPRGLYLLYEDYLIERLGERDGGAVHLARSRNDINATVLRLRLRGVHHRLLREVLRLVAALARGAQRHAGTVMPIYTHHQAALPVTYGHYLAGVAVALLRDLEGVEAAAAGLERSPLGAGAAGGTTVAIDPERTARLLGFESGVLHSLDAVASRDGVLRLLSAAAVLGVTLSRLAADLQLWSTAEFGLIAFPDELVGSSSMMPQKRNAFLLEHVQGRAGAALGAFNAAAMAMHATPFSNSVAVGTEAVKPVWGALEQVTEAVVLARLCVDGAQPRPEVMRWRAVEGFTPATELANRLVLGAGISFRQAHHRIGALVAAAAEGGEPLEAAAARCFAEHGAEFDARWLDPAAVAATAAYGGGPADASLRHILAQVRAGWAGAARRLRDRARRWRQGDRALDAAVAAVLAGSAVSGIPVPSAGAHSTTEPAPAASGA
ncbi:MAG TPA: argininosuccinate lyase [Longimicrobium sp.]|nr:argininosuccinate lyase [Longimicrobium sp.]